MHHTLLLVPNVHWIVIEDSEEKTPMVTRFLAASGIPYTHVAARTPPEHRLALCEVVDKTKGCPEGTVGKLEASVRFQPIRCWWWGGWGVDRCVGGGRA